MFLERETWGRCKISCRLTLAPPLAPRDAFLVARGAFTGVFDKGATAVRTMASNKQITSPITVGTSPRFKRGKDGILVISRKL